MLVLRETGANLARPVSATCRLFDSAMRQGDTATAERLAKAASRLATRRPDDQANQLARGLLASQLLWAAPKSGARDRAREWLTEVTAGARNAPYLKAVTAELGKCAAGLISAYWQARDVATLTQAWKIVLDQNRPWWQRFDVLVGTLAGIAFIGLMIMVSRDSR